MPGTLIFIISTWGFIAFLFVGIGQLAKNVWGETEASFGSMLDSFWVGFAFLVFFLQWWNFWFPVNKFSFYTLSGISIAGFLLNLKTILPLLRRINFLLILLMGVAAIFLAGIASFPYLLYDHGLYYSNMVQWAGTFPVVKGLGNLYSRLAFNNSYFLFAALVESFPWIKKSHHFITGVLFMGLLTQIFYSYFRVFESKSTAVIFKKAGPVEGSLGGLELQHLFYALMLWPVIFLICTSTIASPGTDAAVSIIEIVLFAKFLALFDALFLHRKAFGLFFFIIMLSILGICIKPSILAFSAGLCAITVFLMLRRNDDPKKIGGPAFLVVLGAGLGMGMVPCIARNVLVSGYIFYPMAFGGFPVAWKVPQADSAADLGWVMSWSRSPGSDSHGVLGNMNWFWPWLANNWNTPYSFKIPLILALAGFMGITAGVILKRKIQLRPPAGLIFIPAVWALMMWFIFTPDGRFAGALFWILSVSSWILLFALWAPKHFFIKLFCALFFLSAISYLCFEAEETIRLSIINGIKLKSHHIHLDRRMKLGPAFNDVLNDLPEGMYAQHKTDSGIIIYTPLSGEDCWDKIPCTPYFDKRLRLIRPGELSSGFVISRNHPY